MKFEMNQQVNMMFNQHLYDVWTKNIKNTISFYDMHLKKEVFDNLEITLSPHIAPTKRIIVEALRDKYAPRASIRNSGLDGSVKMK